MKIRIEGPYYGHYSLARVNVQLAKALAGMAGVEVSIGATQAENWHRDAQAEADLLRAGVTYSDPRSTDQPDVVLRHTWPIEHSHLKGRINLRLFPWEETRIPYDLVDAFNANCDGLLAPSRFVARVMEHSGVSCPVLVLPNAVAITSQQSHPPLPSQVARFLHISSCFPRKGVDVLIRCFAQRFAGDPSALLTIKTFANPHNTVARDIEALSLKLGSAMPSIRLIESDYSDEQMLRLIDDHHFMVMPSRGEGFGLPVLEAHLRGKPAIIPRSTALAERFIDGCDLEIASRPCVAESHVASLGSLWYEPDANSLTDQLGVAHAMITQGGDDYTKRASRLETAYFENWPDVAADFMAAAQSMLDRPAVRTSDASPRRLVVISSFNQLCGIATYTRHLLADMDLSPYKDVVVLAPQVAVDEQLPPHPDLSRLNVLRCWQNWADINSQIAQVYEPRDGDDIIIQHHTGFFSPACLDRLLEMVAPWRINACVTLHSVLDDDFSIIHGTYQDLVAKWAGRFRFLVHSVRELSRLGHDDVVLFPHPIEAHRGFADLRPQNGAHILASFGFLRPHKGYPELIEAWPMVLSQLPDARLLILSSLHPAPDSREEEQKCRALIEEMGLGDRITMHTAFLDETNIQAILSYVDGVIFPYGDNNEGASGAMRLAMSSHAAIAASHIPLFDEFKSAITLFDRQPDTIARVAISLLCDTDYRARLREQSARLTSENSYRQAARWLMALMEGQNAGAPSKTH